MSAPNPMKSRSMTKAPKSIRDSFLETRHTRVAATTADYTPRSFSPSPPHWHFPLPCFKSSLMTASASSAGFPCSFGRLAVDFCPDRLHLLCATCYYVQTLFPERECERIDVCRRLRRSLPSKTSYRGWPHGADFVLPARHPNRLRETSRAYAQRRHA